MPPRKCGVVGACVNAAVALVLTSAWAGTSVAATNHGLFTETTTPRLDRFEIPPPTPFESGNDEQDLLTWAAGTKRQRRAQSHAPSHIAIPPSTQLLIGVKSAVIHGFPSRQLIRQTWADPSRLPADSHVVFLGCEPNWSVYDAALRAQWRDAVQLEKLTYRDLLTDELACHDSYFSLVDKVKGFLRWTASQAAPHLAFVMIADDDVFIRVDALFSALLAQQRTTIPRRRFYAGQVIATQFELFLPVDRNPQDKNAVPLHEYPMTYKPPFASGAHYLLSMDLVAFLARNHDYLKGVGTLEDVSVAYWLLALLQLQPVHIPEFDNVRYKLCHKWLIGYADLTHSAMRRMDHNVRHNKSLCDGFSFHQSDKRVFKSELTSMELLSASRVSRPLRQHWELEYNTTARTLQVRLSLSATDPNETKEVVESTSVVFTPATHNFAHFCHQLHRQLQGPETSMATTEIPHDGCYALRSLLTPLLDAAMQDAPAASHVLALATRNLRHGLNSADVTVRLTQSVAHWRVLIECLLAAAFPDAHVAVIGEHQQAIKQEPDIVVATGNDLRESDFVRQLPAFSRLVVIASATNSSGAIRSLKRSGVVYIASAAQEVFPGQHSYHHHHQLHVPLASLSFVDRRSHSPRQLLQQIPADDKHETVVGFCGCTAEGDASIEANVLIQELQALGIPTASPPPLPTCAVDTNASPQNTAFYLDTHVHRCQQLQFAIVFEDSHLIDTRGHISDRIVSAFLAGSIPIYYGHSATVAWLFNRNAFIDCRALGSMSKCAAHVAQIHSSVDLYEAMRREPPVENYTAFSEVFSWHPDVVPSEDFGDNRTLGGRFKELLLRS